MRKLEEISVGGNGRQEPGLWAVKNEGQGFPEKWMSQVMFLR